MSLWHVYLFIFVFHGLCLEYFACVEAKSLGFTIDMIHRDSPKSPFYNSSKTPMERYISAIRGSTNRINRILSSSNNDLPESQVVSDNGGYLINFSLGSPPIQFVGTVDTGSDLLWAQCNPCISCYKQRNPIFNPQTSSTYKELTCTSQECQWLNHVCSGPSNNTCKYNYAYAGGTYSIGNLAIDTLTLTNSNSGKPLSLNNIIFGCGHNNTGASEFVNGIFSLGGGPLSLVSQIGSFLGSKTFSQCLVPFRTSQDISSKLTFGIDANVEGKGVISIPLVPKEWKTVYFVNLKGFSVGEKFIPFYAPNATVQEGNMFIDSGTTAIYLPQDLYYRLENELTSAIPIKPLQEQRPSLCYHSQTEVPAPVITAHFEGGDIKLPPTKAFIPVGGGVNCFIMTNYTGEIGAFGNFGQVDFLISFDLEKRIVSFKPTDCTKSQ